MEISHATFQYEEILAYFQLRSQSVYIVCASIVVVINLVIIYFLLTEKPLRKKASGNIVLISLAVSDVAYELATTPLFLHCDSLETKLSYSCRAMYAVYMLFNISTVLHIIFEMVEKGLNDYSTRQTQSPVITSPISIVAWCASFILAAYIFASSDDTSLLNEKIMVAYLGRFKAFGYYIYAMVTFSLAALLVVILLLTKRSGKDRVKGDPEYFPNEPICSKQPELTREESQDGVHNQLVFSCLFSAFVVGTLTWVLHGSSGEIMQSIEVMKCFEIIRMAGRILVQLTVIYRRFEI